MCLLQWMIRPDGEKKIPSKLINDRSSNEFRQSIITIENYNNKTEGCTHNTKASSAAREAFVCSVVHSITYRSYALFALPRTLTILCLYNSFS